MSNNLNLNNVASIETQKSEDLFSAPNETPLRVVSGLKNVAEYFGCHPSTIVKNYRKGLYGNAVKRFGKIFVLNPEKLWNE